MSLQDGLLDEFGYQWVANARNGGGSYATDFYPYPWRIILHEIQGAASLGMIQGHPYCPQLWYDPISRAKYQTVPLTRSGFALYQGDQAHYTNKACALQVEIAGFTGYSADETDQMLLNIAEDVIVPLVEFVRSQGGDIDLTDAPAPPPNLHGTASEYWEGRMGDQRWADFNGLGSHLRTPGNDHWDTGAMDVPRIARYAIELLGSSGPASVPEPKPPPEEDEDMLRQVFCTVNKTVYVTDGIDTWPLRYDETRVMYESLGLLKPGAQNIDDYWLSRLKPHAVAFEDRDPDAITGIGTAVNGAWTNLDASLRGAHEKLGVIGKAVLGVPAGAHAAAASFAGPAADPTSPAVVSGRQRHQLEHERARVEAQLAASAVTEPPQDTL